MATKQLYAARDFRYGTRMLRAGDPVEMKGPDQRLYSALGAVTDVRPRPARAPATETATEAPAAPKPRKRTRKAKK